VIQPLKYPRTIGVVVGAAVLAWWWLLAVAVAEAWRWWAR
jgi:hypothetical protein